MWWPSTRGWIARLSHVSTRALGHSGHRSVSAPPTQNPADDTALAKAALRATIKARRDALPAATRADYSARITAQLLKLDSYRAAQSVLAYMPFGSEFDARALAAHALAHGKHLLLPRVERGTRTLALHRVRDLQHDLQPGLWGIPEPRPDIAPKTQVYDFEWVLVPGLAFTQHGDRLGYGAGFYDRLIAACTHQPTWVAAAFAVQLVERIPCTATDQRVHQVMTELGATR